MFLFVNQMNNNFHQTLSAFLGFTFWSAGMVKLFSGHLFIGWIGPPTLVEQLSEYNLGLYAQFIAGSQIVIGYMLLTTRFKLLGGIMLIPMIANILVVTISQKWTGTPYVLSVLLGLNFLLLWQYRPFFLPLFNETMMYSTTAISKGKSKLGHLVWLVGLAMQFVAVWFSFQSLVLGFVLSGIGVLLGILAFRVDRYYFRKATHPLSK